jgi:hypothetical protein
MGWGWYIVVPLGHPGGTFLALGIGKVYARAGNGPAQSSCISQAFSPRGNLILFPFDWPRGLLFRRSEGLRQEVGALILSIGIRGDNAKFSFPLLERGFKAYI